MPLNRRGFSLIEVVIALVIGMVLLGLAFGLARRVAWLERNRGERAALGVGLRTGAAYLARELEAVGRDSVSGSDLAVAAPGILQFRAQRDLRATCRVARDTILVLADTAFVSASRRPAPGRDSLLLYLPGDSSAVVDAWLPLPLVAGPAPAVCPGGERAVVLATVLDTATIRRFAIPDRTALRTFEVVAVRLYPSAGRWYLGIEHRSAGAGIQPFAGPFRSAGFNPAPIDGSGLPTVAAAAAGVLLRLVASTDRSTATGLAARAIAVTDSIRVRLGFRNAP